jgi:hypothetical protein
MQDDKKLPDDLGTAHEVILVQSDTLVKQKEKALPQNLWVQGSNISRMEAFGFFAFPR